jgi:excisionase family DNA binding protein
MAQNYYNVEKAAEVLGVSPDEVNQMRERRELYGYRDGASWKFKAEDIDRVAQERREGGAGDEGEVDDVLLSERELGASSSASGTVIGVDNGNKMAADSDIQIVSEGPGPAEDDLGFKEMELSAEDDDLTLDDTTVNIPLVSAEKSPAPEAKASGDSAVDLSQGGDDDDLVLSGSGSGGGSDVTIGGDSGISLVDPADSGLSLEAPLDVSGSAAGGGSDESLELGEDDILTTPEEANLTSPTQLRADDDFLLTPLSDAGDEDDSSSGSQVIALDTENPEEVAALVGGPATASMVAMLDEDAPPGMTPMLGGMGGVGMPTPGVYPDGDMVATLPGLPEEPYSVADMALLSTCLVFLSLCGMMAWDLVRNMWGWESGNPISSALMEMVLGIFGK